MLHISTIIVFMVIMHALCTMVLMLLWIQNRRRYQGTGLWAANMTLKTMGLLLIVMRGIVPYWMATVFATTLIVLGEIFFYQGLGVFLQIRIRQLHNIVLLAVYIVVHSYFAFITESLAVRNFILSVIWLCIGSQCVWLLLIRVRAQFRLLALGTGIATFLYALINTSRILEYFIYPNPKENYLESGIFEAVILISFQVAALLLTYSLSFMVNKRLSMDIELQEEKYSKAFYSAPYAVLLTRECDGTIFEANRGFEDLSGYSVSEVIGKTTLDLDLFFDNIDRDALTRELDQKSTVRDKELKFRAKTGKILTGLYSGDVIVINNQQCIISTINDITERKLAEAEREQMIKDLKNALAEIKTLGGMLPICSSCKKIRNDRGYWQQIESYIRDHSEAQFSHSLCPDCIKRLYPDLADDVLKEKE